MPKVTVVMAAYNRAHLIDKTIESVRAQTFADWELIVTDDASSDNTPQKMKEWCAKDARIFYIRNEINQGISKNYNVALHRAKGEYVAMIDDDDPWIGRDKLTRQVEFLDQSPEYVGCGAGVVVIDQSGKELYRYLKPQTDAEIRKYMLFSNPMANSTTLFRLGTAKEVGLYDETTRYSGDRDFWLKMGLKGKLCNFPKYFSYYTISGSNTSISKLKPHLKASLMIMKRYKGEYPGYSAALALNTLQYWYAFLPEFIRKRIHFLLARLKRVTVG